MYATCIYLSEVFAELAPQSGLGSRYRQSVPCGSGAITELPLFGGQTSEYWMQRTDAVGSCLCLPLQVS